MKCQSMCKAIGLFLVGGVLAACGSGASNTDTAPPGSATSSSLSVASSTNNLSTSVASSSLASIVDATDIQIFTNDYAFAALKPNGEVVTWGHSLRGGNSDAVDLSNIKQVFPLRYGFLAVTHNDAVIVWGRAYLNKNTNGSLGELKNIKAVYDVREKIVAVTDSGQLFYESEGYIDVEPVADVIADSYPVVVIFESKKVSELGDVLDGRIKIIESNVISVKFTFDSLYFLKGDGTVSLYEYYGETLEENYGGISDAQSIATTKTALAVLLNDGTVQAFGDVSDGGDTEDKNLSNITALYASRGAFAALSDEGNVITWGNDYYGGSKKGAKINNIKTVIATEHGFSALSKEGLVTNWNAECDDNWEYKSVIHENVSTLHATNNAYAAITYTGEIIAWGDALAGGAVPRVTLDDPSQLVSDRQYYCKTFVALNSDGKASIVGPNAPKDQYINQLGDIKKIVGGYESFGVITNSGLAFSWELANEETTVSDRVDDFENIMAVPYEAFALTNTANDVTFLGDVDDDFLSIKNAKKIVRTFDSVAYITSENTLMTAGEYGIPEENTHVVDIFATDNAFAALKEDGSVMVWGDSNQGGDLKGINLVDVKAIGALNRDFVALHVDGTLTAWGDNAAYINESTQDIPPIRNIIFDSDDSLLFESEGGDYFQLTDILHVKPSKFTSKDVNKMAWSKYYYAMLNNDGDLFIWDENSGYYLTWPDPVDTNVANIKSSEEAIIVTRKDGTHYLYGDVPSFTAPDFSY